MRDKLSPFAILVSVQFDPTIAIVTGQRQVVFKLRAHNSLVIVGG